MNGHWKIIMALIAPAISWAAYVTYSAVAHGQWIVGHEAWATTTLNGVTKKIDEGESAIVDRMIDSWGNQTKWNEQFMGMLTNIQNNVIELRIAQQRASTE